MRCFKNSALYRSVIWGGLLLALLVLGVLAREQFLDPRLLYFDDFVEYWAAGKLNLTGGNPYDPVQIKAMEMQTGRL